jgi:hypothetical protein
MAGLVNGCGTCQYWLGFLRHLMKKNIIVSLLCLSVAVWSGCAGYQGTKFAPLEARLKSTGYGGAQTMVLVNSSGQELHHVEFRAYLWGQSQLVSTPQEPYVLSTETGLPERVPGQTYIFGGSSEKLAPGEIIHLTTRDTGEEFRILLPVAKVQIMGRCDEGDFRETWLMSGGGQLELVGVPEE